MTGVIGAVAADPQQSASTVGIPLLAGLIARADVLRLHEQPQWQALLHLGSGWSGTVSRVDDPRFFLAVSGKYDAQSELHADLAAFIDPLAAPDAVRRFPARFEWLCAQLGVDRACLPVRENAEFEAILKELAPRGAALVFPSAFLSQPASMFGHTLLIVHSGFKNALLSQAVNYAAVTLEKNGMVFAFKGIFGLYPGFYSLMPYYQKVQEYTDLDQRDIWEYELDFTDAELRGLLLHVWELRGVFTDYYFFDENCSFNLLYLLDAARPDMRLHEHTAPWVIPLDTVKLIEQQKLLREAIYRPSRTTRVRHLASRLPAESVAEARALARGSVTVATGTQDIQARTLDLAAAYLQSLRGREVIAQAEYQPRLLALLNARSRLGLPPTREAADPPLPPARPDRGHPSARLSIGGGAQRDGGFAEVGIRPAYHDLRDPSAGFLPGSQIEFANIVLRWYEHEQRVVLHRFDVVDLKSFAAVDRFYQPVSWEVGGGLLRERTGDDGRGRTHAYLAGGAGLSAMPWPGALATLLIDGDIRVIQGRSPHYAVGLGPVATVLVPVNQRVLLTPYGKLTRFALGDTATNYGFGVGARATLGGRLALSGEVGAGRTWGYANVEGTLRLNWFF